MCDSTSYFILFSYTMTIFILTIFTLSLIFNFLYDLRNLWMAMCIHLSDFDIIPFPLSLFFFFFLLFHSSFLWIEFFTIFFFKFSSTWIFLFFFSSLSFISLSFCYFSLPLYLSYFSPPILIFFFDP